MKERLGVGLRGLLLSVVFIVAGNSSVQAGEVGHYSPAMMNMRDFFIPDPGVYGVVYGFYYTTDRLNDASGDKVRSLTLGPGSGPSVTLGVETEVDVLGLAPALIWVPDWNPLGLQYGALIAPSFANNSVGASLSAKTGRGVTIDESQFGVGDLFVQPLWLGLPLKHWDVTFGYGFYAPVGKYDVDSREFPLLGVTLESPAADNIGLGFWTHQLQSAVAWYPWEHKATAVTAALTYEIHHEKEDLDITPGSNLTLNWGISQYLPLTADETLLLETGPTGYSQWQLTDDHGSDAVNGDVHDQVHAVGAQLGLTYVPWSGAVNLRYLYEFAAEDRFQGQTLSLSLAIKF